VQNVTVEHLTYVTSTTVTCSRGAEVVVAVVSIELAARLSEQSRNEEHAKEHADGSVMNVL
jgi:hypothetical protein